MNTLLVLKSIWSVLEWELTWVLALAWVQVWAPVQRCWRDC